MPSGITHIKPPTKERTKKEKKVLPPLYIPFGRVVLNIKQLTANSVLLIKHAGASRGPVNAIRRTDLSEDMQQLLLDLVDTQRINYQLQKWLEPDDKALFKRLLKVAGLTEQLEHREVPLTTEDYVHRMTILQGAVRAGNHSPDIFDEALGIVDYLSTPLIGILSPAHAESLRADIKFILAV